MGSENHPVWTVYDKLRSARLNVKYYCCRLQSAERWNFALELVLLAAAPTSAIAGLWFWDTDPGKFVWKTLGVIAAFAALLKPLLGLTKKIKEYESIISGYRVLEFDLMEIKSLIEQKRKYDAALQADLKRALQRERTLVGKTPETREVASIKRKCEEEVNRELPVSSFFIPEDLANATRQTKAQSTTTTTTIAAEALSSAATNGMANPAP